MHLTSHPISSSSSRHKIQQIAFDRSQCTRSLSICPRPSNLSSLLTNAIFSIPDWLLWIWRFYLNDREKVSYKIFTWYVMQRRRRRRGVKWMAPAAAAWEKPLYYQFPWSRSFEDVNSLSTSPAGWNWDIEEKQIEMLGKEENTEIDQKSPLN